jgi:hypothetical protein
VGYTPCRRRGHATLYRASYVASRTLTDPLGSTRTMNRSAVVTIGVDRRGVGSDNSR